METEKDLKDTKLLQSISTQLLSEDNLQVFYDKIIEVASKIIYSEYASIQMFHPAHGNSGKLQLLAFYGFSTQAAEYLKWLDAETTYTTCCEAIRKAQRVIAPNVKECSFMQGTEDLAVLLQTGVHAVQSTPLISRSGRMLGIISTHWRSPYQPSKRQLRFLDVLARQAATSSSIKRPRRRFDRARSNWYSCSNLAMPCDHYLIRQKYRQSLPA